MYVVTVFGFVILIINLGSFAIPRGRAKLGVYWRGLQSPGDFTSSLPGMTMASVSMI